MNITTLSGIRTSDHRNEAAADLSLRPHGYEDLFNKDLTRENWGNISREKTKELGKPPVHWDFVQHKTLVDCPGIEGRPPLLEVVMNLSL